MTTFGTQPLNGDDDGREMRSQYRLLRIDCACGVAMHGSTSIHAWPTRLKGCWLLLRASIRVINHMAMLLEAVCTL